MVYLNVNAKNSSLIFYAINYMRFLSQKKKNTNFYISSISSYSFAINRVLLLLHFFLRSCVRPHPLNSELKYVLRLLVFVEISKQRAKWNEECQSCVMLTYLSVMSIDKRYRKTAFHYYPCWSTLRISVSQSANFVWRRNSWSLALVNHFN